MPPYRGYIDWGFDDQTLLHTGKYIKYPKNSRCQRWIKRDSSRRIRNCWDAPAKRNFYRRLFDYIAMANCQLSLAKSVKLRKSYKYSVKTVYYRKIALQYAESGLEVVLTFRDDLFSCLQRLCGLRLHFRTNHWQIEFERQSMKGFIHYLFANGFLQEVNCAEYAAQAASLAL